MPSNLAKGSELIDKNEKKGKQNANTGGRHLKNNLTKDFGYHNKDENGLMVGNLSRPYNSNI